MLGGKSDAAGEAGGRGDKPPGRCRAASLPQAQAVANTKELFVQPPPRGPASRAPSQAPYRGGSWSRPPPGAHRRRARSSAQGRAATARSSRRPRGGPRRTAPLPASPGSEPAHVPLHGAPARPVGGFHWWVSFQDPPIQKQEARRLPAPRRRRAGGTERAGGGGGAVQSRPGRGQIARAWRSPAFPRGLGGRREVFGPSAAAPRGLSSL